MCLRVWWGLAPSAVRETDKLSPDVLMNSLPLEIEQLLQMLQLAGHSRRATLRELVVTLHSD